jgi:putative endopeptidase
VIDGFTADQRFYLGWAQDYRAKFRDASLRRSVLSGRPFAGRVSGLDRSQPGSLVPGVRRQAGQGLYLAPDQRVKIW